jgi:hypothetical protein
MIRLLVKVIGINPGSGAESELAAIDSDQYDPDHLDEQVRVALVSAAAPLNGGLAELRVFSPQVSVLLSVDNEVVRPSLRLSVETVRCLSEAGASFDFDPYV